MISSNKLIASDNNGFGWGYVSAKKGFPINGQLPRTDNFPGIILYYFEVTIISSEHR
jgi:hypothetical protein